MFTTILEVAGVLLLAAAAYVAWSDLQLASPLAVLGVACLSGSWSIERSRPVPVVERDE